MAPRPWTVLRHDPIVELEPNLWAVESDLPLGPVRRRMSVVRRADGGLLFHNAIPLAEEWMRRLEAFGRPAVLVVPNGLHRLDIHAFKARYPRLRVHCPAEAHRRVAAVIPVDGHWDDLPPDPDVRADPLPGSRFGEAALVVRSGERVSLLFGDTVMNLPRLPGLQGLVWHLLGSTCRPRVTPVTRLLSVSDPHRLSAHLAGLADLPGLTRLVVSHGTIVEEDAPGALRAVARDLHPSAG
ncbi:MAG TPA: hypothetical protein VEP68_05475 [Anaeromyxobacteraceae bacterium]|nr:hypothetical protein [Anaeromyxobacteraceae bacterium]